MDCIFDCFFEQTFMRLERSSLQMRKKRNDVIDHLNSIIEGCSQGKLKYVNPPLIVQSH